MRSVASLNNLHIIVTSGPTREAIDPVRYISNHSSGKQGHAIAAACAKAGARVTLVCGPVTIPDPAGVKTIRVESAKDMMDAVLAALPADIAICAAAVADWRPANPADHKLKKRENEDEMTIKLVKNPDILATLAHHASRPKLVVGFAAETGNPAEFARAKLESKGVDLILANDISNGAVVGKDDTHLFAVTRAGIDDWGKMDKTAAAEKLVRIISERI